MYNHIVMQSYMWKEACGDWVAAIGLRPFWAWVVLLGTVGVMAFWQLCQGASKQRYHHKVSTRFPIAISAACDYMT